MFRRVGRAAMVAVAGAAWRNRRQLLDGARRLVGRGDDEPVGAARGNPARTMSEHDGAPTRVETS